MDTVEITCYNRIEVLERHIAIMKYMDCMLNSEGAEHERYESIYFQLISGCKQCSDKADWRAIATKPYYMR